MMQTLICPHWAPCHAGQEDDQFMRDLKPKVVKLFFLGDSIPRLDVALAAATNLVILRHHGISENYDRRGIRDRGHAVEMAGAHADAWWGLIPAGVPRDRIAVEGLNEPRVWPWGSESPELTSAYYAELMRLMGAGGVRVVAGNLSVGWPGNGEPEMPPDSPPIWRGFEEMIDAINRHAGFLGMHEYHFTNGPRDPVVEIIDGKVKRSGGWGWWCGRFEVCPWDVPIIITEAGIDAHVMNQDYFGWHGLAQPRESTYFGYLVDYEMQCILDGRVVAITPFTHDFYDRMWATYDTRPREFRTLWLAHARDMEAANYILPAAWSLPTWSSEPWRPDGAPLPPSPPPPAPVPVPVPVPVAGPEVVDLAQNRHDLAWLTNAYGVTVDSSLVKGVGHNLRMVSIQAQETAGHMHDAVRGYHEVRLIDEAGNALAGWAVGRTWPGAPNAWPNGVAPDNVTCPPEAKAAAIFGTTNADGSVSWVAGPGDIAHNKDGANTFWPPSHELGCDVMRGGGIFGDPSGKAIVWVPTFQVVEVGATQPPPPTPTPTPTPVPAEWGDARLTPWKPLVMEWSDRREIDPLVVGAIVMLESAGQSEVISTSGAVGLMQVMPFEAGAAFSDRPTTAELLNPGFNIEWGTKILRDNLDRYGDLARALAGYYGGRRCAENLDDPDSITYLEKFREWWRRLWGTEPPVQVGEPGAVNVTSIRWNAEEAVREIEASQKQDASARARLLENVIAGLYKIEGNSP